MTYVEFKEQVEDMGFKTISYNHRLIIVVDGESESIVVAVVSESHLYVVDADHFLFKQLDQTVREQLYTVVNSLTHTSIEDREKYLLKLDGVIEATAYLNYSRDLDMYKFDTKNDSPRTQSEFTREEIATLPLDLRELVDRGILRKIKI